LLTSADYGKGLAFELIKLSVIYKDSTLHFPDTRGIAWSNLNPVPIEKLNTNFLGIEG